MCRSLTGNGGNNIATRGRPKGSGASPTKKASRSKRQQKTCAVCEDINKATKDLSHFYATDSALFPDGHVPYCKECIQRLCFNEETQSIDIEAFKKVLRQIDKPYIESALQMSIDQYNSTYEGLPVMTGNRKKIIGWYFSKIATIIQYRNVKTWDDGVEYNEKEIRRNNGRSLLTMEKIYDASLTDVADKRIFIDDGLAKFRVTKEMIFLFGNGYKKSEYKAMWEKYQFLKKSYPDVTNLHTEALVSYVKLKVKEELAILDGDAVSAVKWGQAATTAADKAKINPSQLSKSDLQGGLNSFSELFQAVEQAVDIIPILPKFKYRPNDAPDFVIWCLVNYLRDLEGKPLCEYEDIYAFYDERKKEYVEQYGDPYGIFKDDTSEDNREAIKKFITVPKGYNDFDGDDS